MKTYLINLQRRPDRRAIALEQCKHAGIDPVLFNAIDGNAVRIPEGFSEGRGALGCAMSHAAVLGQAIKDKDEMVFVLEDDVTFVPDFQTKLAQFLEIVPPDWEAVFIGGQHINPPTLVRPGVLMPNPDKGIHRTHAYIVRGEYIRKLHQMFATAQRHIDWIWGERQHENKVYAPVMWLAGQGESYSDIMLGNRPERIWHPVHFKRSA